MSADSLIKWDHRYLELARQVSTWSKDPSTKCGAVIVRPDRTVASLGYNGFPKGVDDSAELYNDRNEKLGRVIHAEVNAILNASEPVKGYTMYTWPAAAIPSCDRCTTNIIQSGIMRVVHYVQANPSLFEQRWLETAKRSKEMYEQAGVTLVPYLLNDVL